MSIRSRLESDGYCRVPLEQGLFLQSDEEPPASQRSFHETISEGVALTELHGNKYSNSSRSHCFFLLELRA